MVLSNGTNPEGIMAIATEQDVLRQAIEALKVINRFNNKYTLPIIVLSGIIGNLLALAVFTFSPLRRLTISVYLGALSLTDIIFLIFLGLGWLESMQINIFQLEGFCQTMVFVTFVVSFLSLWFIVTFTAELYFSIYCTSIHRLISRPRRALCIALLVTTVACTIYMFSFWLTRSVKTSETGVSCGFSGSRSAAIVVSIMDSMLTLIVPFSLLIFMYIHIVYTLASISNRHYKVPGRQQRTPGETRPDNLLAKAVGLGMRIRRSFNNSPRSGKRRMRRQATNAASLTIADVSSNNNNISSSNNNHNNNSNSNINETIGVNRRPLVLERGKKISFSLPDGEIRIDDPNGGLLTIAKIVVRKESLGITIAPRRASQAESDNSHGKAIEIRRLSCPESRRVFRNKSIRRRASEEKRKQAPEIRKAKIEFQNYNIDKLKCLEETHEDNTVFNDSIDKDKEQMSCLIVSREEQREDETFRLDENTSPKKKRDETHVDVSDKDVTNKRIRSLNKVKRRCLRMIICIAVTFLVLNLPSHVVRLQSMLRSLFDSSYTTSELEHHLQQFFQTIYYFNFIANFLIYSGCAKSFRMALIHLPWHVASTFSQIFKSFRANKGHESHWTRQRRIREKNEHSRLVEICIPDLHLSQIPSFAPDYKCVSPPCLLKLEESRLDETPVEIEYHDHI